MNKLTVTHDLQFRCTLLRFLANTLPLTHRSGKNQFKEAAMDGITSLKSSKMRRSTKIIDIKQTQATTHYDKHIKING